MKSGESKFFQKSITKSLPLHDVPCTWPQRVSGLYKQHTSTYVNIRQHTSTYVSGLRQGKTPLVEPEAYNSLLKRRKRKPEREEVIQRVIEVSAKCDCLFHLRVERCTVFRKTKSVNCARFAILDSNLNMLYYRTTKTAKLSKVLSGFDEIYYIVALTLISENEYSKLFRVIV